MTDLPQAAVDAAHAADVAWVRDPGDGERGGSRGTVPERQLRVLLDAAAPHLAAAERERIMPLLLACHKLYDTYWHKVGTVEIDDPGLNGISYDDTSALDDAAEAIELLLADGDFADLICNPEEASSA